MRIALRCALVAAVVLALGTTAACTVTASREPRAAAPSGDARPSVATATAAVSRETSDIWAGHLVLRSRQQPAFAATTMRLAVPAVSCPVRQAAGDTWMVSFWNGLGGWSGDPLLQAGIEVTCGAGNPVPDYSAFYEVVQPGTGPVVDLVPHTVLTPLATHPVRPGDLFSSTVEATGEGLRATLSDTAAEHSPPRWRESVTAALSGPAVAPRTAECIVERPTLTDGATGASTRARLARFSPAFAGPRDSCTTTDRADRTAPLTGADVPWAQAAVDLTRDGTPTSAALAVGSPRGQHNPLAVTWSAS